MVGRYLKLDSDLILFSIHRRLMRMIVIVCVWFQFADLLRDLFTI